MHAMPFLTKRIGMHREPLQLKQLHDAFHPPPIPLKNTGTWIFLIHSLYIPYIFPGYVPCIFPCVFLNLFSQQYVRT